MSWIELDRSLGPPTGSVRYIHVDGKYFYQWIIREISVRFGYLERMVSPYFECTGIQFQFIMDSKVRKSSKTGKFELTFWGKSVNGVIAHKQHLFIKYKLTLLDKQGTERWTVEGQEHFFGCHVSIAYLENDFVELSDLFSEEDELSVYLEMETKTD